MSTWAQQIAASGVIRHFRVGELPSLGPNIVGYLTEGGYGYSPADAVGGGTGIGPTQDLTNGYDVGGAVRFDCPSPAPSNLGTFIVRFSDDRTSPTTMNAIGVSGEGAPYSEVFVQVAIKWDANFWDTTFLQNDGTAQGGIKVFDLNTGWPIASSGTSTYGFVVQTVYQSKVLNGYAYGLGGAANAMWDRTSGNYALQNQNTTGVCDYYLGSSGCHRMVRDGWTVIHLRTKILDRVNANQVNYECDISMKAPGGSMTLVNTWNQATPGYDYKRLDTGEMYGGIAIFPYMTGKNQTQTYTAGYVCADNIIVSTQSILTPDDPTFVYGGPAPVLKAPFRRRIRGNL
jgi:hypothetical protein